MTSTTIQVELFARLREIAGAAKLQVELPSPTNVHSLRQHLSKTIPGVSPLLEKSAIAVNDCYAADGTKLQAGDRVAIVPPVSGG